MSDAARYLAVIDKHQEHVVVHFQGHATVAPKGFKELKVLIFMKTGRPVCMHWADKYIVLTKLKTSAIPAIRWIANPKLIFLTNILLL